MEIFQSRAIVFRTVSYSERSIILELYTEAKGLRSYIVNGVRGKGKNNKAAYFQHGNLLSVVAYDRTDGKLARLKEYGVGHPYKEILHDVIKSSTALFLIETARNAIYEREQNTQMFDFIWNALVYLDKAAFADLKWLPIRYLLSLSEYLGIQPQNNYSSFLKYFDLEEGSFTQHCNHPWILSEHQSGLLTQVLDKSSLSAMQELKLNIEDRRKIIEILLRYIEQQIPLFKEPRSFEILRNIFH